MYDHLRLLLLLICFPCVVTKPMEDTQVQAENDVVNMEANKADVAQQPTEAIKTTDGVADRKPANQDLDHKIEVIDNKPANEVTGSVDAGPMNENSQVTAEATSNEHSRHVSREQVKDDIDWGHGDTAKDSEAPVNFKALEQLEQQQQEQRQKEQQQQEQQQREEQQRQEQQQREEQQRQKEQQQQEQQQREEEQRQKEQQQQEQQQREEQQRQKEQEQQQREEQQRQKEQQQQEQQQREEQQRQKEQQQQELQQQEQQRQEQQQHQQEFQHHAQETDNAPLEQQQRDGLGQHSENDHKNVGVVNAENLMHGDGDHVDHHNDDEKTTSREEQEVKLQNDAIIRFESELKELNDAHPKIMPNVHDGHARSAAEFMKHRQFGPDDAEEALHAGHHVHDENADGAHKEAKAGDDEMIANAGERDHEGDENEEEKLLLTLDPEEMMHAGQGVDHVHDGDSGKHQNKDEPVPGAETFELNEGDDHHKSKEPVGPEFEAVVHDGKHVHVDLPENHKPRNKVRYQDILDLNLTKEMLKGIDLSKLLEQEKKEMEDWHRETQNGRGDDIEDLNETERSASFWQKQVTDLRKKYLTKLYEKVRHISNPDLDSAEWEKDDEANGQGSKVHEGETQIEHEMEMWASTIAKGDRKPLRVMQDMWEKSKHEHKKGEEGEEHKGVNYRGDEGETEGEETKDVSVGEEEKDENSEKEGGGYRREIEDGDDIDQEQREGKEAVVEEEEITESAPGDTEQKEDAQTEDRSVHDL